MVRIFLLKSKLAANGLAIAGDNPILLRCFPSHFKKRTLSLITSLSAGTMFQNNHRLYIAVSLCFFKKEYTRRFHQKASSYLITILTANPFSFFPVIPGIFNFIITFISNKFYCLRNRDLQLILLPMIWKENMNRACDINMKRISGIISSYHTFLCKCCAGCI